MKRTAGLVLAVIGLTSGLALPGYCWTQQVSSQYAIAPAAKSARNNIFNQMAPDGLNAWTSNGPKEGIQSLAVDPSNPNTIYAGSRTSLYKTTDGGATWSGSGLGNTQALAIDFVSPNILYAGTRSSGIVFAPGDRFLLKSTDGGASWSNSSSPVDWDIGLLLMDPTSPNTLYAGSAASVVGSDFFTPWKSTDGGATWNGIAFTELAPYGWAINPANPQTIYAPGENTGLFKSADGGANWSATGLTNTVVGAVAIDLVKPDTLYAGTKDNGVVETPFRGMLKSSDGGNSWFAINNGLSDLFGKVGDVSGIAALAFDPDDPNILYAGTSGRGVFRSPDGGASWNEFNLGLTNRGITALAIDPLGKHLYAATGFGVFDYQYATSCADQLSPTNQSFDSIGGTGFVNVTAGSECRWTAASNASWISVTSDSGGGGSGTVRYSVAPNETKATAPRIGIIGIAARFLTVTQAGAPVRINSATVSGKKLFVTGENFDAGAVILLNGEKQKTLFNNQNSQTALIGKNAGKRIKPGDLLKVRNPNGTLSQEFIFTGS